MTDIVSFTTERLDDDLRLALDASGGTVVGEPRNWKPSPAGDEWEAHCTDNYDEELLVALRPGLPRPPAVMGGYWGAIVSTNPDQRDRDEQSPMSAFRHAARHDPARVLADIAAKRKIVAECDRILNERRPDGSCTHHPTARHLARHTLWNLAAPFAEHPDYAEVQWA